MTALMCTTRVAVVDEYDVVRAGLESWLATEQPLKVAGSFAHPSECLAWLPTHGDVDIPDIECLRELCAVGPAVVVYSRLTGAEVILACLDAGARCFVAKADGRDQLIAALESVGAGVPYVSPRMADALNHSTTTGRLHLSDREKQVLMAWLRTDSKDEVAESLHIAPATVRTHVQRVRIKYANAGRPAPTKSALLARAIEDGIVGLSDLSTVEMG